MADIEGWVKLHRKLMFSEVFCNEGLLKVWIYCLCRANRKKRFVDVITGRGKSSIQMKPGDFIFGRNRAAEDLGMSPSTVKKRMDKLREMGNINVKSNSHYSIVSICNWESYQSVDLGKEQASNRQVTGKEQASNTDKTGKTGKNKPNIAFSAFWDAYKKKEGDKPRAERLWLKLSDSEREFIMGMLPGYVASFTQKKYQPYPTSFLNQRRWENEDEINRSTDNSTVEVWT